MQNTFSVNTQSKSYQNQSDMIAYPHKGDQMSNTVDSVQKKLSNVKRNSTQNTPKAAVWYAQRLGWYVFPIHSPIFDSGACVGCTCESYKRSAKSQAYLIERGRGGEFDPAFKCSNPGKCPAVKWADASTVDINQITRWWGKPWRSINVETGEIIEFTPNIGIDCGKSGLLVFDSDSYKNAGYDLVDLISLPDQETVTVLTQGGGEHFIYDRQGKAYGNATRGLPAGIDIRGVGGYIVAAPSIGKSGNRYSYLESYGPHEIALHPIPAELDAILSAATTFKSKAGAAGEPDSKAVKRSLKLVSAVLEHGNIKSSGADAYLKDGRRWILPECPFNPENDPHAQDAAAFVIVMPDGRITAGCHHNRCQKQIEQFPGGGWQMLKYLSGYSTRTQDVFGGAL